MDRGITNYIEIVKSDVAALVYSDGEGASFEDKFTEYCLEVLDAIGKCEGARAYSYIHPNSQGGIDWKINGYCLRDEFKEDNSKTYFETLDLFITHFNHVSYDYNITKDDFTKGVNQIKRFVNASLKGHINYIDPSKTELIELLKILVKQKANFDRINIYYLINGNSNHQIEKINIKGFDELDIFIHVWDIPRFYKLNESHGQREPIEINFKELVTSNYPGLQSLKVPIPGEVYECYLTIIPGSILSKLYKEYSSELLESNVRAFLGQTGKYNKPIQTTIREKPEMFLPYNNGITATADYVETETYNNQLYITKLKDFQIVNGGQTTASLFHTQKKHKDVDLNKVFVQMKLTVIKDIDKKNIEVPNIARFANSQNKVTDLDLSSNNPYFVHIESLSRKKYVVNPENRNQSTLWYFERVNGQYRAALNKLNSPAQQKKFKEQNPTYQKFVKSDIAKFINLWELEPHIVAQGAQKSFIHYTKKINEFVKRNTLPGENFYKKLIANAIVYNTADKLFGRKNTNAIGDTNLKSYTVAYTISYFHFLTGNRLDLWKIYAEQGLNNDLNNLLKEILVFVYIHLLKNANNTLISEYAKRESSWKLLKEEKFNVDISGLSQYFITEKEKAERDLEKDVESRDIEAELLIISEIKSLGLKFWDGLKIFLTQNEQENLKYVEVFDLVKKIKENKNLDKLSISTGIKVLEQIKSNHIVIEKIKAFSELQDSELKDIKTIYDKMKLLRKEDWSKIIDLGSQTNIFTNLELANIKSVVNSFLKNELIKEQSLLKADESILKLQKFGLKY